MFKSPSLLPPPPGLPTRPLQALLGSSRFCQLLAALRAAKGELDPAASPTLAALAELADEFPPLEEEVTPQAQQQAAAAQQQNGEEEGDADEGGEEGAAGQAKAAQPTQPTQPAAVVAPATRAAGAKAFSRHGGAPFLPHMLMEVVDSFRPLGGSRPAPRPPTVIGAGAAKPRNGGVLAVSEPRDRVGGSAAGVLWGLPLM